MERTSHLLDLSVKWMSNYFSGPKRKVKRSFINLNISQYLELLRCFYPCYHTQLINWVINWVIGHITNCRLVSSKVRVLLEQYNPVSSVILIQTLFLLLRLPFDFLMHIYNHTLVSLDLLGLLRETLRTYQWSFKMPHRNASRNSGFRINRAEKFFNFNFKYHNNFSGKLMNSFTYIFSTYKFFKYPKYFKYLRTHIKMHTRTYIQIHIQKSIQYLKYHKYFKYFKCFDCSCLLSSLGTIYLISVEKPRTYSRTDFKNNFFKYLKFLKYLRTHTRTHTRSDIQIWIQKLFFLI